MGVRWWLCVELHWAQLPYLPGMQLAGIFKPDLICVYSLCIKVRASPGGVSFNSVTPKSAAGSYWGEAILLYSRPLDLDVIFFQILA